MQWDKIDAKKSGVLGINFTVIFLSIFFISGACSLIYETIWMRYLVLFFGSDIYSSSITLAAFMGGFALGGCLASYYVDKIHHHLIYYAILEFFIGLYAIFFSKILNLFDPFIAVVYTRYFEYFRFVYYLTKIIVAFLSLLLPTAFMGATLSLILKAFTKSSEKFGETASSFYTMNSFGALTGVLIAGFMLIPSIGLKNTNLVAVGINFLIAIVTICLIRFTNIKNERNLFVAKERKNEGLSESIRRAVLIAAAFSGFGSFALEVIWIRILIQGFSGTVYSFSIMLVTFLFGIAIGSSIIARKIESSKMAVRIFIQLQTTIAISIVVLTCFLIFIPEFFSTFVWGFTALSSNLFGFGSVLGMFVTSGIFMIFITVPLGASFPAALKAYSVDVNSTGTCSGRIVFINTLGCITGALTAGFLFIPFLGTKISLLVLSVLFFVNGLYVHYIIDGNRLLNVLHRFFFVIALLLCIGISFFLPNQIVLNYNIQKGRLFHRIYHAEGISNTVDVLRTKSGATILSIDGNIEADTSLIQRRHFILKAQLPLMLFAGPKDVLVVGLGLGITTSSLLKDDEVAKVDIVELLPAVIKAQTYLRAVNGGILSDPRLKIHIDDGRNFLKFNDMRYNIITSDPIHPRISGVGILYTKEYYELIRDHLKDNGVVLQWIPLYSLSPRSFEVAVRTMVEIFPNTSVWCVPGHIMLLGAKDRKPIFDYEFLQKKFKNKTVASDLASIGVNNMIDLLSLQIMSPNEVKSFLDRPILQKLVNTENFPYLEYYVPFEFLITPKDNLKVILPYAKSDPELVSNAPLSFIEKLSIAQEQYRISILKNQK